MSCNDSMKLLSDEIAAKVYREQQGDFVKLLRYSKLVNVDAAPQLPQPACENDGRIGVWTLDAKVDAFVRDSATSPDWLYWAQIPSIPATSKRKRILLLGESVTRGMLYDPAYTPAQVLEHILGGALGDGAPEVLDLARTNASMETVRQLAQQAEQLKPEVAVIFAGNNWSALSSYFNGEHTWALMDSLRREGIHGVRQKLEELFASDIEKLIDEVAELYAKRDVPVFWVIPEFNLKGWRDPEVYVHWLNSPGDNQLWLALRSEAEKKMEKGDFQGAATVCEQMLALDKGDCATTAYFLSVCYEALRRPDLQRHYLEMARDASIVDFTRTYSPRITTLVEKVLRSKAVEVGHQWVDLKQVFSLATGKEIADSEVFLDYCHMTSKGIRLSMGALGKQVLERVYNKSATLDELLENAPWPSDADEADANLLAAIHNAHWGQDYQTVRHYCDRAAEKSPEILELMGITAEIQCQRLPIWMNARAMDLLEKVSPQVRRHLFSLEVKCLDLLLLDAFSDCSAAYGVELASRLSELRLAEHSVEQIGKVDLLDPYYHSTSLSTRQFLENGVNQRNDFFKAYEPVSRFRFISQTDSDCMLSITLKSINTAPGVSAKLQINGELFAQLPLGDTWRTHEIRVPAGLLRSGFNRLEVAWPVPMLDAPRELDRIGRDIRDNAVPEIYPVFGHIYAFEARRANHASLTTIF